MERNLMVAGFGGQGVMTLGKFLAEATCESTDKNVTFFPSYGAEQRGGTANCYVVISDDDIGAPLGDQMDDLIVMNDPSLSKFLYKLVPGGTLYINSSIVKSEITRTDIIPQSDFPLFLSPACSSQPPSGLSVSRLLCRRHGEGYGTQSVLPRGGGQTLRFLSCRSSLPI